MLVVAIVVLRFLFYSFILMGHGCGSCCCDRLLFYSFILMSCGCVSCDNGLLWLVVATAGCNNVCWSILIGCGGF